MTTQILPPNSPLTPALQLLHAGEPIAFPTETVYGIGADARSNAAVEKIFTAKGRPKGNPLIVHIADAIQARACVLDALWPERAQHLAEKFWPGPLTMILPRGESISPLVSAGRATVALRCPDHPIARQLLTDFAGPIAAPSANRSGFTSPTTAAHVLAELNGRIPLIIDGGPCRVGLESTVLDLTTNPARILRPGAITAEKIEQIIGPIEFVTTAVREQDTAESPGQHHRHYAPQTPAHLVARSDWPSIQKTQHKSILLTHDPKIALQPPHETILMPPDPDSYARTLYAALRNADEKEATQILILQPDTTQGLWAAITDRLQRATAPLPMM